MYSRTCLANGQWSGSHPIYSHKCRILALSFYSIHCRLKLYPNCSTSGYCGEPGTPTNGRRNITGYTEGHTVNYTCNTGYRLSGFSTLTCQLNGLWSANLPTCLSKFITIMWLQKRLVQFKNYECIMRCYLNNSGCTVCNTCFNLLYQLPTNKIK